jgi:hypothetical protein
MKTNETEKFFVHKKIETLLESRFPKASDLVGIRTTLAGSVTLRLHRIFLDGIRKFLSTRDNDVFEECKLEMAELIDLEFGPTDLDLVQTCAVEFLDDFAWELKNGG